MALPKAYIAVALASPIACAAAPAELSPSEGGSTGAESSGADTSLPEATDASPPHSTTGTAGSESSGDVSTTTVGKTVTSGASGESSSGGATTYDCPDLEIHVPPPDLGLDPFYAKYVDADGIPVIGSAAVDDEALFVACEIALHMLALRPDVRDAMMAYTTRIGVIATSEVVTDMPEYADLYDVFPGTDWNSFRGLGATKQRPLTGIGEENVLQFRDGPLYGESIVVHEFAHSMWNTGIVDLLDRPQLEAQLDALYVAAIGSGLWAETYAATNAAEYWAEGVQGWFNTNLSAEPPNGIHNHVDTREALREYDGGLADFIALFYPDDDWEVPEP